MEKDKECFLGMNKYFWLHNYSREMKSRLVIYNLNGKVPRWWRDLKYTEREEVKEIRWSTFCWIFQEKYMFEIFFDKKSKIISWVKDGIPNYGFLYLHIFGSIALCTLHKGRKGQDGTIFGMSSSNFLREN